MSRNRKIIIIVSIIVVAIIAAYVFLMVYKRQPADTGSDVSGGQQVSPDFGLPQQPDFSSSGSLTGPETIIPATPTGGQDGTAAGPSAGSSGGTTTPDQRTGSFVIVNTADQTAGSAPAATGSGQTTGLFNPVNETATGDGTATLSGQSIGNIVRSTWENALIGQTANLDLDSSSTATNPACVNGQGQYICFNKIEAAIFRAQKELEEIELITTALRNMPDRLMDLDQCIPGPDYGYQTRARELLSSETEWLQSSTDRDDQQKQGGAVLELTNVIRNIELEMSFTQKNFPMAQEGLGFVNAVPTYHEMMRDYLNKRTSIARSMALLQNLDITWKNAKTTNNQADIQNVISRFSSLSASTGSADTLNETIADRHKIESDVVRIGQLTNQCLALRNNPPSFAGVQTYIGSKILQPINNIVQADDAQKLFCSVDPYHVNNLTQMIACQIARDFRTSGPFHDACMQGDNDNDRYNTDTSYRDLTLFGINQSGMEYTFKQLLQQHNMELSPITIVEDDATNENVFGEGGIQDTFGRYAVQIDDEGGRYAHNLYTFNVRCEDFYSSSRYDYIDELAIYGY